MTGTSGVGIKCFERAGSSLYFGGALKSDADGMERSVIGRWDSTTSSMIFVYRFVTDNPLEQFSVDFMQRLNYLDT